MKMSLLSYALIGAFTMVNVGSLNNQAKAVVCMGPCEIVAGVAVAVTQVQKAAYAKYLTEPMPTLKTGSNDEKMVFGIYQIMSAYKKVFIPSDTWKMNNVINYGKIEAKGGTPSYAKAFQKEEQKLIEAGSELAFTPTLDLFASALAQYHSEEVVKGTYGTPFKKDGSISLAYYGALMEELNNFNKLYNIMVTVKAIKAEQAAAQAQPTAAAGDSAVTFGGN